MKAITSVNQKWLAMVDEFFLKTIPPDLDLTIKWISAESDRYRDAGFKKVCSERMRFITETVQTMPDGEMLLALDSDMTFFVPEKDERSLSQYIIDEMLSFDMGFQDEQNGITHNIGIWAIRCTPYVKKWFVDHLTDFINAENDQDIVNLLLLDEKVMKIKNFHRKVFGGMHLNENNRIFLDKELRIFHATVYSTRIQKVYVLDTVREAHKKDIGEVV